LETNAFEENERLMDGIAACPEAQKKASSAEHLPWT
jgi:hypothetical protein